MKPIKEKVDMHRHSDIHEDCFHSRGMQRSWFGFRIALQRALVQPPRGSNAPLESVRPKVPLRPRTLSANPLQTLSPEDVQAHRPGDSKCWLEGQRQPIPEAEASHLRSGHSRGPSPSPSRGGLQGWMPTARALSTRSVDGRSPSCETVKIKPAWKAHPTPPLSRHTGQIRCR